MFKTNNFEDSIIIEEFENSKIFIIDNLHHHLIMEFIFGMRIQLQS